MFRWMHRHLSNTKAYDSCILGKKRLYNTVEWMHALLYLHGQYLSSYTLSTHINTLTYHWWRPPLQSGTSLQFAHRVGRIGVCTHATRPTVLLSQTTFTFRTTFATNSFHFLYWHTIYRRYISTVVILSHGITYNHRSRRTQCHGFTWSYWCSWNSWLNFKILLSRGARWWLCICWGVLWQYWTTPV